MESEYVEKVWINPRHPKRIYTAKWIIEIPPGEPYVIVRPRSDRGATPHNLLVYATIDALRDDIDGYRADSVHYPGLKELNISLLVGKHRIDLITSHNGELRYWEIKTPREIGEDRTWEQIRDYAEHLREVNLVTTEDAVENAREIIKTLGLTDKVKLWVVKPHLGGPNEKSELIYIPIDKE